MSDFALHVEKRQPYLVLKGMGTRRSLASIFEGTREFSRIVAETESRFILLDYSEVVTTVSVTDIFNITRLYDAQTPAFIKLSVSIVINPAELHFENFWEEICVKRGFNFKIFLRLDEAENWLVDQMAKTRVSSDNQ